MTNSELRRRKNNEHNNVRTAPHKRRKEAKGFSIHTSLLCLILSGTILTVFLLLYVDSIPWHVGDMAIDSIAKKFGYHKPFHAVVIDAGSTGSRVLAFTFHESYLGARLVLDQELFEYTKPGLSSFVDDPDKAVVSIANLLEKAKNEINADYWESTPLILKATAGLRLLPNHKAERLLASVRELFRQSPFLTGDKSVDIMDGTDEGIFSWFTVNFLLESLSGNPSKTVAALDLGGGSTQVTFSALTPSSLSQKQYIHEAISPSGKIPVYTHSAPLGLMAARKEIITFDQGNKTKVNSECINHIIKDRKFHYGNVDYYVSGPQEKYKISKTLADDFNVGEEMPIVNFNKCSSIIKKYVLKNSSPPEELRTKVIFAFSYYFDRATEAGLIDPATGGRVQVSDFKKAAEKSCHEANAEQPFMCLDLTFIWTLLEHGLGLKQDTRINLFKKINGHEISWALGAAYDLLKG